MDLILFWGEPYTTSPPENTEQDVKTKESVFRPVRYFPRLSACFPRGLTLRAPAFFLFYLI